MTERARILASLSPIERQMYLAMGGRLPIMPGDLRAIRDREVGMSWIETAQLSRERMKRQTTQRKAV